MRVPKDYTGYIFGKWTVLKRDIDRKKHWFCKCSCGNIVSVSIDHLKRGTSTKCQKCKGRQYSKAMTTHGESKTRLYYVWLSMRNRCNRPGVKGYENYGGRGIKVCEEWLHSYENFRNWSLANGYAPGLQIDRINNDGDYSPDNCRWVSHLENMQNTSRNKKVIFEGKLVTRTELAMRFNLSPRLIGDRLRHGWTVEEAISYQPCIGSNQTLRGNNNG
jgi:hypothetical protein